MQCYVQLCGSLLKTGVDLLEQVQGRVMRIPVASEGKKSKIIILDFTFINKISEGRYFCSCFKEQCFPMVLRACRSFLKSSNATSLLIDFTAQNPLQQKITSFFIFNRGLRFLFVEMLSTVGENLL